MRVISQRAEPAFNLLSAECVPGRDHVKFHSHATVVLKRSCLKKLLQMLTQENGDVKMTPFEEKREKG